MSSFLPSFPSPLIIAELGAKYAELPVMKRMIDASKASGADMVKFQTYEAATISTPGSFFTFEDGSKVSQYEFFKKYELNRDDHIELDKYCGSLDIPWISTPSHPNDVLLLEEFNPIAYKTGSDDLTNIPFLRHIAEHQRPMIVSTGMCTLSEIERAVNAITQAGCPELILLHCVVSYPARIEDANLRTIETLRHAFGVPVGLSDHTIDEFTSILATQMGAVIIEKHFTLNHALKLADHQASLDSAQFKILVDRVRLVSQAMGDGVKRIWETEKKWRAAARKSLFSTRAIRAGEIIAPSDVTIRRPGNGIHPHQLDMVIGRVARRDIPENTLIAWDSL